MFELSVALKYLSPRWRQLSVSMISIISILVIALVVWLIVVFFSVTHGLEKSWIQKLITLTAPIRITPTEAYYQSYYYQSDSISSASNYATKTIAEKLVSPVADPYDPEIDGEPPSQWPQPNKDADGSVVDIVKKTFNAIDGLPSSLGVSSSDFEVAVANVRIKLIREGADGQWNQSYLNQSAYLGSLDPNNQSLMQSLLPPSEADIANLSKGTSRNLLVNLQKTSEGKQVVILPTDPEIGEAILLPKTFRDAGTRLGDQGHISYYSPTLSAVQEQRLPVYVAGFYDPGIIPIGGKFIIVNKSITNLIRASHNQSEALSTNGINIRFDDLNNLEEVKNSLTKSFEQAGILPYWDIETYREFDFTRDLIQQLRSERNLWTLIATVIIIVACSNIISMLIILVNDKKHEIGILRSMGATSASIALIFGFCGVVMGMLGSLIGTLAAIVTLRNLQTLIDWIGSLQGHEVFNPVFYGNTLPNQISADAIAFVVLSTAIISLIAGIVPAVKASMLRPSSILRSE